VNSLPKTVTRQRRCCDLNSGPSAPESSTLTTWLPSHPCCLGLGIWLDRGRDRCKGGSGTVVGVAPVAAVDDNDEKAVSSNCRRQDRTSTDRRRHPQEMDQSQFILSRQSFISISIRQQKDRRKAAIRYITYRIFSIPAEAMSDRPAHVTSGVQHRSH